MTNHHPNKESLHSIKSNEQGLKSLEENEGDRTNKKRLIKDAVNKTAHLQFDSDEDGDRGKEFVEPKIEKHFNEEKISKKKRKLKDLQAELIPTNDPRFQLSEQFLNVKDTINDDDEEMDNNEISFEEEKKKSLAILDQITNAKSTVVSKLKPKMIRFDPSKTEHRIYELGSEIQTNGNDLNSSEDIKPKSILKQTKETTPMIDSTRTYDFDQSKLKSMFDKTLNPTTNSTNNGHFQFQFFNNEQPVTLPVSKIFPAISNGKSKTFSNKSKDSFGDDDDNEKTSLSAEPEVTDHTKNNTFFFFDIDDRLKDGLERFVRTEELNELERTWSTKRKEIGEALRTKHRKAIQRKDRHRVFNHRRRQYQHSSSNPTPKTDIE